jgi:signal peptidase I
VISHSGIQRFCYIAESVSESAPIPTLPLSGDPSSPVQSSTGTKRHLFAALFSAIVPGSGQLFLGQRRKGTILLLILAAILIGFWPLRLLRFYLGFVLLVLGWIFLYFYAACSAQLARNGPAAARPSKWWLVAILPMTALTLSLVARPVMRASGFQTFTIPSSSMERTIRQGDSLVADMRYYHSRHPERGEVIIFLKDRNFLVKRVIATSGDSIQGQNGSIFVNGKQQDEPYAEHTSRTAANWLSNFGPIYIPSGKYFVMGDNRDVSFDSRVPKFGLVDDGSIVGKPLYVFNSSRAGMSIP